MQLSRIDLNLFTIFDAIYRDGGITSASKRLHLSQPAVSHALARLRELLGDPLFERQGNEMIPTPRARALAATIGKSLSNLQEVLNRAADFEAATSRRSFRVAMREAHESAFLSQMVEQMRGAAPHIDIAAVRIERRDLEDDLQSGELDVAIDIALPLTADIRRAPLSSEPLVVLARKNHPAISGTLDLATYLSLEHVLVTGRRHGDGFEDVVLNQSGLSRRIRVRCQQHAVAGEVVSQSDLLATLPRSYAQTANRTQNNQLFDFPIAAPAMELFIYWHSNAEADLANQWIRKQLLSALAA